jgi:hypothetical protein
MKIATEHPERQRVAPREAVEEGLLFGRIALQRRDVSRRREQRPFIIESNFADAAAPWLHEATVAAGEAADRPGVQLLDQLCFTNPGVERLREAQRKFPGVS